MIQFGNDKIKEIYHGSDKIKEVYHGSDLVWSGKKPSYAILTDDTRVDFELDNTPINNFATTASTVVINGSTITKTTIKELVFGDSYSVVTSIGDNFLRSCSALPSLDLSAFSNVTNIGNQFLSNCSGITSVDLSVFSNVTSIGTYAFRSTALTSITLPESLTSIGASALRDCTSLNLVTSLPTVPPSLGGLAFYNTHANLIIKVPSQSVNAYKAATNWNSYASIISAI